MTATMKSVLIALSLVVLIGIAGAAQREGRRPAPPRRFRNVQVLKKLSPEQLMATMRTFTASLGVRCDFCHVERAFDRDDKPQKRTAREMIRLVERLNAREKVLDRKATCFMCHHGRSVPETAVPMGLGGFGGFGRPGGERGEPERDRR